MLTFPNKSIHSSPSEKKWAKSLSRFFAFFLVFFFCLGGGINGRLATASTIVTTTGAGAGREAALRDAMRLAAEHVLGTYLASHSLTKDNIIITDDIYTKTAGFVNLNRIIQEGQTPYGYRFTADFSVDASPRSDLMKTLEMIVLLRDPRITVIAFDDGASHDKTLVKHEPAVENAMSERLIELGFNHVVDAATVVKLQDSAYLFSLYQDENHRLGKELGALGIDYLIISRCKSSALPVVLRGRETNLKSARAIIHAKMLKADTGDLLGSFSANGNAVDSDASIAKDKALIAAARNGGNRLQDLLSRHIQKVGESVYLEIDGTSDDVLKIADDLQGIPGVISIYLRETAKGRGLIEADVTITPIELYRALSSSTSLHLLLESTTNSGFRVSVKQKEP